MAALAATAELVEGSVEASSEEFGEVALVEPAAQRVDLAALRSRLSLAAAGETTKSRCTTSMSCCTC